ncbi:MAG: hypothetical protein LBV00_02625 [Propionibacteriaceae bacterium]|jgi:hypothetical protein|nr:hypothetical protein [Propionibacteriaceae bacterium]
MWIRNILGEALRNLASGTAHALWFASAWLVIMGGVCGLDLWELLALSGQVTDFHDRGGSTMVLTAPGHVDGVACDELAGITGIEAAGAIRVNDQRVDISTTPRSPLPISEITAGFARLLDFREGGPGGLLASASLADHYLDSRGTISTRASGATSVAGVFSWPDDGRAQGLAYTLLSVTPANRNFDECWARIWPPSTGNSDLMGVALAGDTPPGEAQVTPLNTTMGSTLDPTALFANRRTQWLPIAGAAACSGIGFLAVWLRRLECAATLDSGVPRLALSIQLFVETAWWSTLGCVIVSGLLVITGAQFEVTRPDGFALAAGWPLGFALLMTWGGAQAGLACIQRRALMVYFKHR